MGITKGLEKAALKTGRGFGQVKTGFGLGRAHQPRISGNVLHRASHVVGRHPSASAGVGGAAVGANLQSRRSSHSGFDQRASW